MRKRPPQNDATFCRLRGWTAGTVLTLEYEYKIGRTWKEDVLITALGEKSILVKRLKYKSPEEQWTLTLLKKYVVLGATTPAASAREGKP